MAKQHGRIESLSEAGSSTSTRYPITAKQILAIRPNPAPPPLSPLLLQSPSSTMQLPSSRDARYRCIRPDSLSKVPGAIISRFRTYVQSMTPTYRSCLSLPLSGFSVTTEHDVSFYLDAQVIVAAWQVVLAMVPGAAVGDLLSLKQQDIEDQALYQSFGVGFTDNVNTPHFEAFTIIQFAAPDTVHKLHSIIDKLQTEGVVDPPVEWVAVTKRLRKYADTTHATDFLLMDNRSAFYFRFSDNPLDEYETVEYLFVNSDDTSVPGYRSALSLREMVAFACWRSISRKGIPLTKFNERDPPKSEAAPDLHSTTALTTILQLREKLSSEGKSEPGVETPQGDMGRSPEAPRFHGWVESADVTMERVADPTLEANRETIPILGLSPGSTSSCPHHDRSRTPRQLQRPMTFLRTRGFCGLDTYTQLRVDKVVSRSVAVLYHPEFPASYPRWVAKFFSAAPASQARLAHILRVYGTCPEFDGVEFPFLYGTWKVDESGGLVLLTEYINARGTSTTLHQNMFLTTVNDRRQLIAGYQKAALKVTNTLKSHGIMWNERPGKRMVAVQGEESVVLVNFDHAVISEADAE